MPCKKNIIAAIQNLIAGKEIFSCKCFSPPVVGKPVFKCFAMLLNILSQICPQAAVAQLLKFSFTTSLLGNLSLFEVEEFKTNIKIEVPRSKVPGICQRSLLE